MNIRLGKKQDLTSYRKIAIASWRHPRDPNTYATLDLPADMALAFLNECPSETPLTLTHYVTKITAYCLQRHPELNHVLRLGSLYPRTQVDIFIATLLSTKKGRDLSGFVIRDVPARPIAAIAGITRLRASDLRHNRDKEIRTVQRTVDPLPSFLVRGLLRIQDFLQCGLNLALPFLGLPRDPFGSAIVSNVGALGIENALIPLSPYSRCPLLIGVGKPRQAPIVRDGNVVAGNVVTITATFDHRYADGAHGARVLRLFRKIFENPQAYPGVFAGTREQP